MEWVRCTGIDAMFIKIYLKIIVTRMNKKKHGFCSIGRWYLFVLMFHMMEIDVMASLLSYTMGQDLIEGIKTYEKKE